MGKIFERRLLSILNSEKPYVLCEGLKGLEKESLRIDFNLPFFNFMSNGSDNINK